MEAVLEQLQKGEDLGVCSGANTTELVIAVAVAWAVRKPMKGNVRRWKPVPEDW
jgi:hypothetical protein